MANTHSLDLESSSSQYASIDDASQTGLDITGDLTLECWVKFESLAGGTYPALISKVGTTANTQAYVFVYQATEQKLYLQIRNAASSALTQITHSVALSTGTWYHVAVALDVSVPSAKFYVDAVEYTGSVDSSNATDILNSSAPFAIGAVSNPGQYFDGLIDEVRVWNDIRTAQEISDNYDLELTGSESNLVGYWKLNNDYTDETSNGNDLTASGSPVFSTTVPDVFVVTNTYTIQARARIQQTQVDTVQARGRVRQLGVEQDIQAKSRIKQLGVAITISAKAFIINGKEKLVQARSRIKQLGVAKSITAKARILFTREDSVSARARIQQTLLNTARAKGRVKQLGTLQIVTSKARVMQLGESKSVQAKARLKISGISYTIRAKGRLKQTGVSKSMRGKAKIRAERRGVIGLRSEQQQYPISMDDTRFLN